MAVKTPRSRARFVLVHLLPFLHLCACGVIGWMKLESGVEYIAHADMPFTILIAPLVFWSRVPLVWFAILGTLWWYLLSRGAELLVDRVKNRSQSPV